MKKFFTFFLIICFITITGCAGSGSSRRSSDGLQTNRNLEVASSLKFQDVPIPGGFKLVPVESFLFDNDITRFGILKYSGRAEAGTVARFFRDQMPLYNWHFINLMEFNMRIINFDRDDQTCTIIIEPKHFGTSLTISVAPKAGRASTYKIEE